MLKVITLSENQVAEMIEQAAQAVVSKLTRFPSIMTKAQVCAYLDKPVSTINRWMKEGMPYRKEGKDYPEFYKPHVDEWLEKRFSAGRIQKMEGEADNGQRQKLVEGVVVHLPSLRSRSRHSQSTQGRGYKGTGRASGG